MMTNMRVETCQFKRKRASVWERGVIINEGNGPIIDMKGEVVPAPIWNWRAVGENVITVSA
jgi:hypothetical protein